MASDVSPIQRVFASRGDEVPDVFGTPGPDHLQQAPLAFLAQHWSELSSGPGLPHLCRIDPFELHPALGYIMLLDVVDGGHDFRYRLYGSVVAQLSDLEMTG